LCNAPGQHEEHLHFPLLPSVPR
jgi:hypothetical protein